MFGTTNALRSVQNGPAHIAAGVNLVAAAVLVVGYLPEGAWVNALVIMQEPAVAAALTAHSGIPGAVIPQGRAGHGVTNRAEVADQARNEKPLFVGIFPHNANMESTIHIGCRVSTLLANSLIKSNGRTITGSGTCATPPQPWTLGAIATGILEEAGIEGYLPFRSEVVYVTPANAFPAAPGAPLGAQTVQLRASALRTFWNIDDPVFGAWERSAPYTLDHGKILRWITEVVQAPAGIGSAFGRNYISFNHALGGTTGLPEHDAAKTVVVLGWAQKEAHRRKESDNVPQGMLQSLRNLATDIYNSGHFSPQLFLAALKSGPHPSKVGLCIPVMGMRIGAGFSQYDRLRSKEVLIPESKAFVSYLIEFMKIAKANKGEALLASEVDLDKINRIIKEEVRRGWIGHSKASSWMACREFIRDEMGNIITGVGSHARDEVEQELVLLKAMAKSFSPRSPILATPGVKNIEEPPADWLNACTSHKKSLREKLSDEETKVYKELLTSGVPNLMTFAKAVTKVIEGDTANKAAVTTWAVAVAHGTLAAPPTVAVPGSAVQSIVNFVNQNARMVAAVYGLNGTSTSTDIRI